jgi:acyl transferase domain-containing protein
MSAQARDATGTGIATLRRPGANSAEPELDNVWTAIAGCYANGVDTLPALYARPPEPAALPSYPWQRQRFWSGVNLLPGSPVYSRRDHPLLGFRLESADCIWKNLLDTTTLLPYLEDHVVWSCLGRTLCSLSNFSFSSIGYRSRRLPKCANPSREPSI